mmetsp:Transcript_14175/g.36196  ORF Transcript_14175/g.36196 Transcript_14175/m.36196 type:complete len:292 (-) Transcript_14175:24-899(-)|eukprot:CAMPEP_0177659816 /NCGR_PEP_ID=MMETSP0447-20121125/17655_1 /TAXON_ID=0 /ORGANISM="Stygamoeba regulata, Strain BSH-02190019" /LENGTH=291 /DNA_ID=CAMNT_0019164733 /DNA_START=69 /DNA_END=944 /DNA_ORIENTATION=+
MSASAKPVASAETERRPRVLLSNDDGIHAPGLQAIARHLHRAGYDLKVVAAKREQSAKGHSITLFGDIDVQSFTLEGALADVTAWMVDGTPVDCVKIALTSEVLEGWKPDLVVSGINRGSNTGMNIHYSGTCGVAREANLEGLPAIALSLSYEPIGMFQFEAAAKSSMPVIAHMLKRILNGDRSMHASMINVNFPNLPFSEHRGYKITKQGASTFQNWCEEQSSHVDDSTDPPVVHKVFQYGGRMECRDPDDSFDTKAMNDGWISVSALSLLYRPAELTPALAEWELFQTK